MAYIKHLVECTCVLSQYVNHTPTVWHRFVVFSRLDELGAVVPSVVQCNNCLALWKVVEVGVATRITGKENSSLLTSKEDIEVSLPQPLAQLLKHHQCPLHTWQEVQHVLEYDCYHTNNKPVVLTSENNASGEPYGKLLLILSNTLWKVDNYGTE